MGCLREPTWTSYSCFYEVVYDIFHVVIPLRPSSLRSLPGTLIAASTLLIAYTELRSVITFFINFHTVSFSHVHLFLSLSRLPMSISGRW